MSSKKNNSSEDGIEKSVPHDHLLSSLGFFYPTLILMIDSYNPAYTPKNAKYHL